MVINENLILTEDKPYYIKPEDNRYKYIKINLPTNLNENEMYTFSLDVSQINGSGELSMIIFNKDHSLTYKTIIGKNNSRNSFSFKYMQDKTEHILLYSDIAGKTQFVGATFRNIKLEKGDKATPYIPNKNIVDPSKQAIFKSGGVFQEVYPLS